MTIFHWKPLPSHPAEWRQVVSDNSALGPYVKAHPKTHIVQRLNIEAHYGSLPQKTVNLIKMMNQVITQAKQDGTYKKFFKKWFGQAPGRVGS